MKETRYFYVPDVVAGADELPDEEAQHALRVLRLGDGDELMLMDGQGTFYRAEVTAATQRRCLFRVLESLPQQPTWRGHLHLAVAPTKMMDRMEWMVEKATEVGFDELTPLLCQFSERRQLKTARLDKIVVSAMKQSRKAWKPAVNELTPFSSFLQVHQQGRRYIAHCYDEVPRTSLFQEFCHQPIQAGEDVLVLVGPEGDFSISEVRQAVSQGFVSVNLGPSRLRTETAGLHAVEMMQLSQQVTP